MQTIDNNLRKIEMEKYKKNISPYLFSVVTPTYGRSDLVEKLLISLQIAIKTSRMTIEIIIIDDSSQQERDKIEKFCQQYGAKYLRGSHNVREKRNYGIEESKGEIIFFTDSDCEVSPNIFNEHLKTYTETDSAGVLGLTKFTGNDDINWGIISRTIFLDPFSYANIFDSAPWGTCTNISFKKYVLEEVGKFDATLPFRLGGDDTEIGVRINNAGYKIKTNPNAIVFHTKKTWGDVFKVAKRAFRWGRADFHILKRHPQLGCVGFPNFMTVFLLILLICTTILGPIIAFTTVIVWTGLTIFIESIIKIIKTREKPQVIFYWIFAKLLDLTFEVGTIFESIRKRSLSMFYKRIVYTDDELIFEWKNESVRSSSIVSGILIVLIIVWILKGVIL